MNYSLQKTFKMEQVFYILNFMFKSFIHVWPYLLITIPLAVWVNLSDFSRHFKTLMTRSPWLSIMLATMAGAFSPFCSCGVIPVISTLLIGGVPLAPVFSFWVASPSMDPEIFFLSVTVLGWELALWRLASTFAISILAGVITHLLVKSGYITTYLRRQDESADFLSVGKLLRSAGNFIKSRAQLMMNSITLTPTPLQISGMAVTCCVEEPKNSISCTCSSSGPAIEELPLRKKIIKESLKSVWMISKFMGLAFLFNALLNLYVPQEVVGRLLNQQGFFSVIIAAVLGVPVYTNNLMALPLVSGLVQLGLHPGAALAFLISGPMTTIPAMVAVYGIASRKVFGLYVFFALFGAMLFGMLYYFLG